MPHHRADGRVVEAGDEVEDDDVRRELRVDAQPGPENGETARRPGKLGFGTISFENIISKY